MSYLKRLTKLKIKPSKKLKLPTDNSWAIIPKKATTMIFNKLPRFLTELEIMYYFYVELGAVANKNLRFTYKKEKKEYYIPKNKRKPRPKKFPTHSLVTLCKRYVALLKRAHIPFTYSIVKEKIPYFVPYTYLFINHNSQTYAICIYQDLDLIRKSRRTKKFAGLTYSFVKVSSDERISRIESLKELEKTYGPFYQIPRTDIKKIEARLNYNYFNKINPRRATEIDNIIQMMRHDLEDTSIYQNYILAGRMPEPHAELRYSLGFIFRHLKAQCDVLELNIEERLEYFKKYTFELLHKKDKDRIKVYDIYYTKFGEHVTSVFRINNDIYPDSDAVRPYTIYIFTEDVGTYEKATPREVYYFQKNLQFLPHIIIEYQNETKKLKTKDLDLLHGIKLINAPETDEI